MSISPASGGAASFNDWLTPPLSSLLAEDARDSKMSKVSMAASLDEEVLSAAGDPEDDKSVQLEDTSSHPMTDSVVLAGGVGSEGGIIADKWPPATPAVPEVMT